MVTAGPALGASRQRPHGARLGAHHAPVIIRRTRNLNRITCEHGGSFHLYRSAARKRYDAHEPLDVDAKGQSVAAEKAWRT